MTTSHYLPQRTASKSSTMSRSESQSTGEPKESQFEEHPSGPENLPPPEYTTSNADTGTMYHDRKDGDNGDSLPPFVQQHVISPQEQHALALQELTSRPATPPPFPSNLPQRKDAEDYNDKRRRRRRMISTIIISIAGLVLITTIIVLGTLLGIARQKIQTPPETPIFPFNGNQTTATATIIMHVTNTSTITQTLTQTPTASTLLTITVSANASTSTTISSSSTPSATSSTAPNPQDECTDQTSTLLSISPLFCTFTSPCNATSPSTQQELLQCLDFCRARMTASHDGITFVQDGSPANLCSGIDSFVGDTKIRVKECCGQCGCF